MLEAPRYGGYPKSCMTLKYPKTWTFWYSSMLKSCRIFRSNRTARVRVSRVSIVTIIVVPDSLYDDGRVRVKKMSNIILISFGAPYYLMAP